MTCAYPVWPFAAAVTAAEADAATAQAGGEASPAGRGEVHDDGPEVRALGARLRCPVCQGMSIGDSPSPMAQDMMRQVRRMRAGGRSEAEIVAYFTARYGDWVLLDPPRRGAGLWVWVLPPVALAVGVAAAFAAVRRRLGPSAMVADPVQAKAAVASAAGEAHGSGADLAAIFDEVER